MELGVSVSFGRSLIEYTYHAQRGLSLGLKELHQEAANLSNSSLNCSCDKLLEDSKDGNIPFILGVSFAAWLVSVSCMQLEVRCSVGLICNCNVIGVLVVLLPWPSLHHWLVLRALESAGLLQGSPSSEV